jgi:cytochrome c-type biogenesis protein CcmH/NrfF
VRSVILATALAMGVATAFSPAIPSAAATARVSLPAIERQVMCVTCKIPLNEAESPQAAREKAFLAGLVAQGRSETQIKNALVDQYGPSVLALPNAKGFNLAVYLVPVLVVLALATLLTILLPSWRRRTRQHPQESGPGAELDADDAARLDADLARFD